MRISLLTEGTYPYAPGGVSVFCDQFIRALPAEEFQVYALTGSGRERFVWTFPENVATVVPVPLWGMQDYPKASRRSQRRFRPQLEEFLSLLLENDNDTAFEAALRGFSEYSIRRELTGLLTSRDAVDAVLQFYELLPPPRARVETFAPRATVDDAVFSLVQLEHSLRAMATPPPRADINHCVTGGLAVLLAFTSRWKHETPFVLGEHGLYLRERFLSLKPTKYSHYVRSFLLSFVLRLTELSYRSADAVVPVCEYNGSWERQVGAEEDKVSPIHNGIEVERYPEPPPEPDEPVIVFVGRIDPLKDIETLLRAFALVRERVPGARLRVYGPPTDPRYAEVCRSLVQDLSLAQAATFEGPLAASEVAGAYHSGQVVALTSISEGFPYAVLEAMAAGRPIVATDVGGVNEAIGADGLLVPPRNPSATADAFVRLLEDKSVRLTLAANARSRVMTYFTQDFSAKKYLDRYSEVLEKSGANASLPGIESEAKVVHLRSRHRRRHASATLARREGRTRVSG